MVSEQWNDAHNKLELHVAGVSGMSYELPIFNAPSGIEVSGATIGKRESGLVLEIPFTPGPSGTYVTRAVTLQFLAH